MKNCEYLGKGISSSLMLGGRYTPRQWSCYNCESHKMSATKIPSECLWHEKWPVWGYIGIESVQSSNDFELSYMYSS